MTTATGNSTDAFMYVKDRDGRMLFCNGAVLRALGKESGEVLGRSVTIGRDGAMAEPAAQEVEIDDLRVHVALTME